MFTAYIIKKRYMLIIDGHDVYEIDEEKTRSKNVNQQPQPHPQPLLLLPPQPKPPQQKSKMIAQIQLLLPLPQLFPPKKEPPLPFPQQQHSNRIIHKIEEHPHPLSVLLHEQFVAAKSLISDLQ